MFFLLSKTLDQLIAPITWVLALTTLAAWAVWRRRARLALRAQLAAVAILYAFSTSTVAHTITGALEAGARTTIAPDTTYDVVVVLGGLLDVDATAATGTPEFNDAADRFVAGYAMVRGGRAASILITSDRVETWAIAQQLADWGIARERILVEDQSRNTHDSAVACARIIRQHGWARVLLVTSAMHMPRAEGCFRAEGVAVDTLAVDRHAGLRTMRGLLDPRSAWLEEATNGLREAVGRIVYWAVGYARFSR